LATRGSGREIPIVFSGLRPGEKLVEELLVDPHRSEPTSHPKIFKAQEDGPDRETVSRMMAQLAQALDKGALAAVYGILEKLVEGYHRPECSLDVLDRGDCCYSFKVASEFPAKVEPSTTPSGSPSLSATSPTRIVS